VKMTPIEELSQVREEMKSILDGFTRNSDGIHISDGDQAKFTELVLDAQDIANSMLGLLNSYSFRLENMKREGINNFVGSQSFHSVEQIISIVNAAIRAIRRKDNGATAALSDDPVLSRPYVNSSRLADLRSISSNEFDLQRLIRMCEELNHSFENDNFLASAMLVRAITDHVPPIFGAAKFAQYTSSVPEKSLKGTMQNLQSSLRNIADGILHQLIRKKEVLPTATQVDFRQDLDALLGEVIRTLS